MNQRSEEPSRERTKALRRVREEARREERRQSFAAVAGVVTSIAVGGPLTVVGIWLDRRFPSRGRGFGRGNRYVWSGVGIMTGLWFGVAVYRLLTDQEDEEEKPKGSARDR